MANTIQTVPLKLSATRPDFEALVLQLQLYLSQKNTWKDRLTSGMGQTLTEEMAAIGAFNQFAIESAAREAFLDTAVRDSSIYAGTRFLGVRINRKSPAYAEAFLTRASNLAATYSLPKFTEFDIDGRRFFNRETIVFPPGAANSLVFKVYEGTLKTQTFPSTIQVFRQIYLNEPGFVVSNEDVQVVIANPNSNERRLWLPISDGIWVAAASDNVYYDNTSGLGDTILVFGDGYHGALPPIGYNIEVTYAYTSGASGNTGSAGLEIVTINDASLKGSTISSVTGGADEKPASYYKVIAPNLYKARKRGVTPPDYTGIALDYPGVASVKVQAQREIAPNDLRWMNVVRITVLPQSSDVFSQIQWNDFLAYFSTKQHAAVHIDPHDPIKLLVDVSVTLAMLPTAVATTVKVVAEANIRKLFVRDKDTLGKRIAKSDIVDACTVIPGIDYVGINLPADDFICPSKIHYFELRELVISTVYSERNGL
jgi:hypothetical protein